MEDTDPLWAALQSLPPEDVVGGTEPNPAELVELLRMEGHEVTMTTPGGVTENIDDVPTGIDQPTTEQVTVGQIHLTAEQWEEVARYLITKHEGATS